MGSHAVLEQMGQASCRAGPSSCPSRPTHPGALGTQTCRRKSERRVGREAWEDPWGPVGAGGQESGELPSPSLAEAQR